VKAITVGQKLSIEFTGGVSWVMLVAGVSDTDVVLDGNYPPPAMALLEQIEMESC
jgi:hypothetical protein